MNAFRCCQGSESAFEQVRLARDSHLDKVPALYRFTFSTPRGRGSHPLCFSHSLGKPCCIEARTNQRHSGQRIVGQGTTSRYLDHPQFERFEVRQTVGAAGQRDAHMRSSVRELR